jgi:hypothetical protein
MAYILDTARQNGPCSTSFVHPASATGTNEVLHGPFCRAVSSIYAILELYGDDLFNMPLIYPRPAEWTVQYFIRSSSVSDWTPGGSETLEKSTCESVSSIYAILELYGDDLFNMPLIYPDKM